MRLLNYLNEEAETEELDLDKERPNFIKKLNYERQNALLIDEIMTEKPWLLKADFKNAYFNIDNTGTLSMKYILIVEYCEWIDGEFLHGVWRNGKFLKGIWKSGTFNFGDFNGEWIMGKWRTGNFKGTWHDGIWYGGIFKGTWKNGKWYDGEFNGKWLDGTWMKGDWKGKSWKTGNIHSEKFNELIPSSKNPKEFYEIEMKCKKIKELEGKVK